MNTRSENSKIARLYESVPPELLSRLRQFRTQYPYKRATVGGTEWRYTDTGIGEQVLLALSGATCIAEMSWMSIEHFAQRNRVIAPDYPALDTMAGLVDGIAGILDREGVRRPHVMGGSYGGYVAQAFVRRHPDRAASLILSHSLLPTREGAARVAKLVRWMRLLPAWALRALFRMRLGRLFPEGEHPELALSRALFAEIVNYCLTKAQLISLMRRVVDLGENYRFTPDDLRDWPGRTLLLMADDDPATPEPVREAMVAMYPQAQVRVFSGAGHLTAILKQDEYFAAIDRFLEG
jgi:pimeloyl-ACP methyl ester carboxylesterase